LIRQKITISLQKK